MHSEASSRQQPQPDALTNAFDFDSESDSRGTKDNIDDFSSGGLNHSPLKFHDCERQSYLHLCHGLELERKLCFAEQAPAVVSPKSILSMPGRDENRLALIEINRNLFYFAVCSALRADDWQRQAPGTTGTGE